MVSINRVDRPYQEVIQEVSSGKPGIDKKTEASNNRTYTRDKVISSLNGNNTDKSVKFDFVDDKKEINKADIDAWVTALHGAMKGLGTNEWGIDRILKYRSPEEISEIIKAFKQRYANEWGTLGKALKSELSGYDLDKSMRALNKAVPDKEKIARNAEALHKAMKGWGTDEDAIYAVFENSSKEEIIATESEFNRIYKKEWGTLRDALKDEMSGGELERAMRALDSAYEKKYLKDQARGRLDYVLKKGGHSDVECKIGSAELKIASPEEKAKLINNLLDGATLGDEEKAIIRILESCKAKNDGGTVIDVLAKQGRIDQLLDDVNGAEYDRLLEVLPEIITSASNATALIRSLDRDHSNKNKLAIHHILDTARAGGFLNDTISQIRQLCPDNKFLNSMLQQAIPRHRPEVIAHRGGVPEFPENTLSALESAGRRGADAIEIYVCVTKDNKIILWHDYDPSFRFSSDGIIATGRNLGFEPDTLFRPTFPNIGSDVRKPIAELNYETVQKNFGYSGPDGQINNIIPTLEEAVKVVKKYPQIKKIYLDVKLPEDSDEVQKRFGTSLKQLIEQYGLKDKVVILNKNRKTVSALKVFMGKDYNFSFDREDLNDSTYTGIPDPTTYTKGNTYVSAGMPANPFSAYTFKNYVEMLKIARQKVDSGESTQKIIAWTVNDELKIRELLAIPVDGIMTDDPEGLQILLKKIFGN